jgi:uncharacterized protein with FMN-binding domain
MRRVLPVVIATFGVLGLLASFHSSPGTATRLPTGRVSSNRPSASAPPPQGPSPSTTPPSIPDATTGSAPRQIDGSVVSNRYGDVQVRITVEGGRLVDVKALQLPQDRERSAEISQFSGPELRSEALRAQSANIHVVSGATYTSDSYAQSLQAALDKEGIR